MKKILIIKMRFPYPVFAGTDHVSYNLIKSLSKEYEVSLICHVRSEDNIKDIPELKKYCKNIITARYPSERNIFQRAWNKIKREFLFLFCLIPRDVTDNVTPEIGRIIKSHLKDNRYDIVQIEYFYAWKYVKYIKNSTSVILSNDAYFETVRQICRYENNLVKKAIRYFEYLVTRRYELKAYTNFDWVFFISFNDMNIVKRCSELEKFKLIPVAMEFDCRETGVSVGKNTMVFVGGMQAFFNRDAVFYFCKEIFPLILSKNTEARFVIVGSTRGTGIKKLDSSPNITVTGAVPDVKPYIEKSALYVAPLRIGTGIKTKILEAMALGKAVITTSVGVQGLNVENNVHICVEDDPVEFAGKVLEMLNNPELCRKIGQRAKDYFDENHNYESASKKILQVYKSI